MLEPKSADPATISVVSENDLADPPQTNLHAIDTRQSTKSAAIVMLPFRQLVLIFIGLALSIFLAALDQTIVSTALPAIASDFNRLDQISWVITAYLLTATAFQPTIGKFCDLFGRKPVVLFAVTTFLVGSALCGAAQSMIMLIIARAVAGIGGGGIFSCVLIIISDLIPIEQRGKWNGILGAMFAVSNIVGPLLGGVFTDQISWRWAFYINLPIGALTLLVVILFLRIPTPGGNFKDKLKRIDYGGTLLIVSALVCLLLAISWGGKDYAWDSGVVIGLFVAGGLLVIGFIVYEAKFAQEPIAPPHLFRVRNLALVFCINFCFSAAFLTLVIYLPLYFQVIRGASATSSGLQLLPLLMGVVVFAITSGFLMERTGLINIWINIGMALLTIGTGLLYTLRTTSSTGEEVGFLLICGVGLGLVVQTTLLAAQAATRVRDLAIVTGLANFFQTIGGVIGIAIGSSVFNNLLTTELVSKIGGLPGITPEVIFGIQNSVQVLRSMPEPIQVLSKEAYMYSLYTVFIIFCPIVGVGFILSLFLENKKLDKSAPAPMAMA